MSIAGALLTVILLSSLERAMGWQMNMSAQTARPVMGTLAVMFTLVLVVSSAVLVAVQLASAQLTPRMIPFVYRNTVRKLSLTVFVFTFTFAIGVLVRIEEAAPLITNRSAELLFRFDRMIKKQRRC